MRRQTLVTKKHLLRLFIALLILSWNVTAATTSAKTPAAMPKPGNYCPAPEILLVTAEELSTSLDLVMRSRAALSYKDRAKAASELFAAKTALQLAAGRGAAARTNKLIDAMIQSWSSEDFKQLLTWFPVLKASLLTLPEGAGVSVAEESIGRAEDIMQGFEDGDAMKSLEAAKHMLACDGLEIPLKEAMQAQDKLMQQLKQNANDISYTPLRDALRNALLYALNNSQT